MVCIVLDSLECVHFQYFAGYATMSTLTLFVSRIRTGVCIALNYVQALAVQWCHEPGYHRKSESSGSWPFVFKSKMSQAVGIPEVALIKWDMNTADTIVNKNKRFSSDRSQ